MPTTPTDSPQGTDAPREKAFLLARHEQRALEWLARRIPARVTARPPDRARRARRARHRRRLRALQRDPASAVGRERAARRALARRLARRHAGARARTERPRYGYYLDHLVDAVATALIGIGLGLSPHMLLATGLVIVLAYLVLSINTYLETPGVRDVHARLRPLRPDRGAPALIALNTALALGAGLSLEIEGLGITALDAIGLAGAGVMLAALAVRAARNLRRLAEAEPSGRGRIAAA